MTGPVAKRPVAGEFVKLLFHERTNRGMVVGDYESRCLVRDEIHEIVTTDQVTARAGDRIDRVGFLGFAELTVGGVVEPGDEAIVAGRTIGRVLGFDDCHFPNHLNVLIATDRLLTATSAGLALGDPIRFEADA